MRCRYMVPVGALSACALVFLASCSGKSEAQQPAPSVQVASTGNPGTESERPLPRLVDLGAGTCIPCKEMAPILEQLRTDYAGRLRVDFVDVWKTPEAAEPYKVRVIPTQIFYAADGRELFRHEGFMGREALLAEWKLLGVSL